MKQILILVLAACGAAVAQTSSAGGDVARPGVKEVQVPFASLKPSATIKVGGTADWVLVSEDAVWIASTKPYSVQRIDPATNQVVARVRLSGEACSGLAVGFGSVWVPVCGKEPSLARVNARTNKISTILPTGPAGAEGGITASADSIWMVTDKRGTLSRIDPATNTVRQRISIPAGSYNPLFNDGVVWITGFDAHILVAVDASTGVALALDPRRPQASISHCGRRLRLDSEPRRRNRESGRYEHEEGRSYDCGRNTRSRWRHLLWCGFSLGNGIRHPADSDRPESG